LNSQITPECEIIIDDTEKISIGTKRDNLLKKATGKYSCFIDDDDLVPRYYVEELLNAAKEDKDCIGFKGIMTTNGRTPRVFIHSLQYQTWFEKDGIYYRNPNHLNPIKTEICRQVGFVNLNRGEDYVFSKAILPFLKTETFIDKEMYYYLFMSRK
jgi:glycosyltransferase involved in cell wall biosynthesis